MSDRTFVGLFPANIAARIDSSQQRVVYGAPGLDATIAGALVKAMRRLGPESVAVTVDATSDVCRLGYGTVDGLNVLQHAGIPIRDATGLRIGVLICDSDGWVFSPTPLLVEASGHSDETPNAASIGRAQAEQLFRVVCPPEGHTESEVGMTKVEPTQLARVNEDLKRNPPKKFDIARAERVFNSELEFVDLSLIGCRISSHKVTIPDDLLRLTSDEDMQKRLRTGFALIEKGEKLSGDHLEREVREIRQHFLRSLGAKYGSVLLRAQKSKFKARVDELKEHVQEFRSSVAQDLGKRLEESRVRLVKMLLPGLMRNPPGRLTGGMLGDRPTESESSRFIESRLTTVMPTAQGLIREMDVVLVYKGVTYGSLVDEDFIQRVIDAYPEQDFEKLFKRHHAAPAVEE